MVNSVNFYSLPLVFSIFGCDRGDSFSLGHRPYSRFARHLEEAKIDCHNDYVSVSEKNDRLVANIKQRVEHPVFVKKDCSVLLGLDVHEISFDKFADVDLILLPKDHWFGKNYSQNPFNGVSGNISLTRPSIWGKLLEVAKVEKDSVLFRKLGDLPKVTLPKMAFAKPNKIFGDYQDYLLGKGGAGEVFHLSYNGQNYAFKKNAFEVQDLEKLQFTRAVIKTHGAFSYKAKNKNEQYLIMQQGQKSLADAMADREALTDDVIVDGIAKVKRLLMAQKKLKIENQDIKPANLLLTDDGIKVIDLSFASTPGYFGSPQEKYAWSFLEALLGEDLRHGDFWDKRFLDRDDDRPEWERTASVAYIQYWLQLNCEKLDLGEKCAEVESYTHLYDLLSVEQKNAFAKQVNSLLFSDLGTRDSNVNFGGPYRTGEIYPQLQKEEEINWQVFWEKRDHIGREFCARLYDRRGRRENFRQDLLPKYENKCVKQQDGQWILTSRFDGVDDEHFHQFIFD